MAQTRSINDLKQLQRSQLKSINKDILIDCILASDSSNETAGQLNDKLEQIAADLAEVKRSLASPESAFNRKLADMQAQIDKQSEIIAQHQLFLEKVDRRERETKLVVLGVPEENEEFNGVTTDEDKLKKIWEILDEGFDICKHHRLGRQELGQQGNRKRPILVEVRRKQDRDNVLNKTNRLKDAGGLYKNVYVKKDVHPNVRKEWKRLREAEAAEKNQARKCWLCHKIGYAGEKAVPGWCCD